MVMLFILSYTVTKKAQKGLYFLRKLKKAKFACRVLVNFYKATIKSILIGNIINQAWFVQALKGRRQGSAASD